MMQWCFGQSNVSCFINDTLSLKQLKSNIELKDYLESKGYYFFNINTVKKDSLTCALITLNQKVNVVAINNIPKTITSELNLKTTQIYLTPQNTKRWIQNTINRFDAKGQSFSEITFTNHQLKNDTLFCKLQLKQSNTRAISKIVNKGYKRLSKRFIKHYLNTKKPFSKQILVDTENKINQLTFVKNIKKPAVLFTKDSTHLYIYTQKVKANKLDALFGFSNQEGSSKIQFNGHVDLSLTNTLHQGETFSFKWNNSGQDQQQIVAHIYKPYIFKSPIGIGYRLNTLRQDSTFVNTNQQISIQYQPHYKHSVSSYYTRETSTVLDNIFTQNISYTKNLVGLSYTYLKLNPWKIAIKKLEIDVNYGIKKANKNTKQQNLKTDIIYDIKINNSNHVYTRNRNGYLKSDTKTENEFYRTGGATTIRGFLEQSITSYLYNYSNLEYRYFNNSTSYLYAFTDFGYFKNLENENNLLSLGLGYTLGTKSGLLKISYAVGKTQNTSFNLNSGLFHINFITLF